RNVVLGLFTWSDDAAFDHREIDHEFSRWGNAADTNNAQFVVQPFDTNGHLVRYAMPTGLVASTHTFDWRTNRVNFQSSRGLQSTNPAPTNLVSQWTYSLTVPPSGDENLRMNLWLYEGSAPANNQEVEVIVRQFEFTPLDSDGDGIPDTWEIQHGFDPNNAADAALDADSDGRSNLEEFRSDTDPRNANSFFVVCDVRRNTNQFILRFSAAAARTYTVSFRDSLSSGSWTNWTNLPAPAFARVLSVTNIVPASVTNRFYRVTTP
ncbi:MAG TPA: thrombospondin type 3 repeat-containing protein, partial [Verrucomicrobiae bacterium]